MAVRRGTATPTKIYRGTTPVKKVMRGTFEVWSATIAVTPAAPTFLAAAPWYTLPTQTGVTYTVSGTPGHSQTVTVTATAQAGYELVGQTSWTHTYGPPPRYSASGSGGAVSRLSRDSWTTIATHTVSATGRSSGIWRVQWQAGYFLADTDVRVLRNGAVLATNSREAAEGWQQVSIPEVSLSSGDNLTFQAQWRGSSPSNGRYIDSWGWSLS